MATTVDTLLVEVQADLSGVRSQLARLEKQTKRVGERGAANLNKLGNAVKLLAGAVVVREFARAANAAVDFASHVEEAQAKSSVVFGRFTDKIRADLAAFGEQVGRSEFQLEEMAASVQDTFVPMGIARGEAADLSVQLAKLATDVASFNNASDTETMKAFQSALVGNHETVRRFGVVITEANLQQELFRMGIVKAKTDVTNAEKIQARLNIILRGTTDAQGDAARTADSYANRVKAMRAELDRLRKVIGEKLMPVFTGFVEAITKVSQGLREFFDSMKKPELDGITKANHEYQQALVEVAEAQEHLNNLTSREGIYALAGPKLMTAAVNTLTDAQMRLAIAEKAVNEAREAGATALAKSTQEKERAAEAARRAAEQAQKELEQAKNTEAINDAIKSSFQDLSSGVSQSVTDMVTGVSKGFDGLRSVVSSVINTMIKKLIEFAIVNRAINAAFGKGGLNVKGFENLPTIGGSASGGAIQPNTPRLVGERGPELIIPKSASVVKNAADTRNMMGGGQAIVVNQSLNFSTGIVPTVRAEVMQMMPQIAESAKAAVADTARRGGSYSRSF